MIACIFDQLGCFAEGATSIAEWFLSLFPFGLVGLALFVGLIVGERLGKWGVLAVILGWFAFRLGRGRDQVPDPVEHFPDGHPDAATLRRAREAGQRLKRSARRTPPRPPRSLTED